MKTISTKVSFAVRALVVALAVAVFGAPGLLAALLNPHGMSTILGTTVTNDGGTAYQRINTTTVTNLTDLTAKAREELWVRRVVFGSDNMYQDNPFADNMMGKPGSGKAIVGITETEKVAGNLVNVPTVAGFGGPGVPGEGDRIGAEQKIRIGNFQVQIGRFWFGVGFTSVAKDETVIGGRLDELINDGLKQQMAKKKSDDIMMQMIRRAGVTGRNYLLPDGVASRAALTAFNVMSTSLITKGGIRIQGNGGKPMNTAKDASGSRASKYVLLGTANGLSPLDTESAYLDARIQAGVRGGENGVWKGVYDDWLGHGIYRWEQINHGNFGPVGSPLMPRAYLGNALDVSGTTTGLFVEGGGSAAAAAVTPAPNYFEFFSGAPYYFFNGDSIAAVTNVNRYLKVTNGDGTSAVLKYLVNSGKKITLPASAVVAVSGSTATALEAGALVEECNVLGVPFCRHIYLAQEAVVCGAGTINGSKADPQFGKRTEEHRNHDMDHGVGVEGVWGCEAVKRADNTYPGFVIIETALPTAA